MSDSVHSMLRLVQFTRKSLTVTQRGRALLLSAGAVVALLVVLLLLRLALPVWTGVLSGGMLAAYVVVLAALAVLTVLAVRLMWPRGVPSMEIAALWIEEQQQEPPSFALVTLVEQVVGNTVGNTAAHHAANAESVVSAALTNAADAIVKQVAVEQILRDLRWRQWCWPFAFVISGLLLIAFAVLLPERIADLSSIRSAILPAASASMSGPGEWRVSVTPPAYSGDSVTVYGNVNLVSALSGSRVELAGRGGGAVNAALQYGDSGQKRLPSQAGERGWSVSLVADSIPQRIQISRDGVTRLFVVEGVPDSLPVVALLMPERDTVVREPRGRLGIKASARDDIGVTRVWFEMLISSGEGERFTVRSLVPATRDFPTGAHRKEATLEASIDLSALGLLPGDMVHIRAVARDAAARPDAASGSSETRTIRIPRAGEYDSVAVEPVPPPEVDRSLLSQRMLLMLTQKLDSAQRTMQRNDVVSESQKLARDQARIRQAVSDIIFDRLGGDADGEHSHSADDGHDHGVEVQDGLLGLSASTMLAEGDDAPVIAINKPLLEAYNAMWEAGRELEQANPHAAIPPMQRALDAIERSRTASRIYLRGRPPVVVIDLAKVRLTGRDTGATSRRPVRMAMDNRAVLRDERIVLIAAMLAAADSSGAVVQAARDSLALLRADVLQDSPALADAIKAILDSIGQQQDLTALFLHARRLAGSVDRTSAGWWSTTLPP